MMFARSSENAKAVLCVKSQGIITSFGTIEGTVTISDKRLARSATWELSLVYEQRLGPKKPPIRETVKKVVQAPILLIESLKSCYWEFRFSVGDLGQYPSSMDLIEDLGVFWWIEVKISGRKSYIDRSRLNVFPSRMVDPELLASLDQGPQVLVKNQLLMIVSTSGDQVSTMPRKKLLSAVIGPKYRHPRNHELRETVVKTRLRAPKAGVLQSPHKTQFALEVRCETPSVVILETLAVKLVLRVESLHSMPEGFSVFGQEHSITCLKQDVGLTIPESWADISQEIADLEIPPVSETTATELLNATYEIRITMVFRAVNLYNFSRWSTIKVPIHVLPGVISQISRPIFSPPPACTERIDNYLQLPTDYNFRSENGYDSTAITTTPPPPYRT